MYVLLSVIIAVVAIAAHGSDGSIVYSIVARFIALNPITHEPLHWAWWHFAWMCTLTTSRSLLNIKVRGPRSRSRIFLCAWSCGYSRMHEYVPWQPLEPYWISLSKVKVTWFRVFFCVHDTAWTSRPRFTKCCTGMAHAQYLAVSKGRLSCYCYVQCCSYCLRYCLIFSRPYWVVRLRYGTMFCPSVVCLCVTFCIVAKRYVVEGRRWYRWIGRW